MAKTEHPIDIHATIAKLKDVLRVGLELVGAIEDCNKPLDYYMLLTHVCDEYLVNPVCVVGRDKHGPVAEARHMFMHMMVEKQGYNCNVVGQWTGRDRSTIHHSVNAAKDLLDTDKHFKAKYDRAYDKFLARKERLRAL